MVDVESDESMSSDDPRLATDPVGPPDGDTRGIQGGLRGQVLNGLVWGAGARIAGLVIQMIGTVVLARLIAPGQFGLFAIAAVFYGFGGLAGNLGLGTAIIHRPKITQAHLSTAFWFNAVIGVGLTLLQIAIAPTLASWLHQPDVTPLIQLVAFAYTLSLSVVPMAILEDGTWLRDRGRVYGLRRLRADRTDSYFQCVAEREFAYRRALVASSATYQGYAGGSVVSQHLVHPWQPRWLLGPKCGHAGAWSYSGGGRSRLLQPRLQPDAIADATPWRSADTRHDACVVVYAVRH